MKYLVIVDSSEGKRQIKLISHDGQAAYVVAPQVHLQGRFTLDPLGRLIFETDPDSEVLTKPKVKGKHQWRKAKFTYQQLVSNPAFMAKQRIEMNS